MAVYTFINAWNMYLWPLLVTGSDSMRTVQIGISMLNAVDAQSISLTMAGIVICMLPSLIIFVVGQKQMIQGHVLRSRQRLILRKISGVYIKTKNQTLYGGNSK